jgi:hypothetical protein
LTYSDTGSPKNTNSEAGKSEDGVGMVKVLEKSVTESWGDGSLEEEDKWVEENRRYVHLPLVTPGKNRPFNLPPCLACKTVCWQLLSLIVT